MPSKLAPTALIAVIVALLLTAPSAPLLAQEAGPSYKVTELASGIYMLEGEGGFVGGNMALSVGDDGVVLIDDGVQPLTEKLMAEIAKLTDRPVDFLINTHVHGDHIGANEAFGREGATIVAHDNLRQRLLDDGMTAGSDQVETPKSALPVVTFSDAVTIHLNGREAHVFHVATAHTDGDAVINFPGDNIIHASDTFFNSLFPFIDLDTGGTVEGFVAAQELILEMANDETKIVPGHGPLASKADLQAAVDMLKDSYARVQALVDAGQSEEEIVKANPLADYHDEWNWGFITTERMTKTLIRAASDN